MSSDDIAPEVIAFVDRYKDRFADWDVLAFFHDNPDVERRASAIALDIGRPRSAIEPALGILVEKGVLAEGEGGGADPGYAYIAGAEFRKSMDGFLAAARDRTNRLAIVGKILQKEASRL